MNPEKRRDIVIQSYLPSGEVTDFWGVTLNGNWGQGWGVLACWGLLEVLQSRSWDSESPLQCWRLGRKMREAKPQELYCLLNSVGARG